MEFNDFHLDPRLLAALEAMGIDAPNPAQCAAIPPALEGRDLVLSAETGSGKTLAYLVPLVQRLLEIPSNGEVCAVILAPTRELVAQIDRQFRALTRGMGLFATRITGGIRRKAQREYLDRRPQLLIATPGRLLELLASGEVSLARAGLVVLDEADRLFELGLREPVEAVLGATPADRQLLMYSATAADSRCEHFSAHWQKAPAFLTIDRPRSLPDTITQQVLHADSREHKLALLTALLKSIKGRKLIFANTREHLRWLAGALKSEGQAVLELHGEMPQSERRRCLREFHAGSRAILLATDVAARGLHIDAVRVVIHWDMPRKGDLYLHRAGRTGRDGRPGEVICLVEAHDLRYLDRIQRYLRQALPVTRIEGLEPRHRLPSLRRKKKRKPAEKRKGKRLKQRLRDRKNKGKPKGPLGRGQKSAQSEESTTTPWKTRAR